MSQDTATRRESAVTIDAVIEELSRDAVIKFGTAFETKPRVRDARKDERARGYWLRIPVQFTDHVGEGVVVIRIWHYLFKPGIGVLVKLEHNRYVAGSDVSRERLRQKCHMNDYTGFVLLPEDVAEMPKYFVNQVKAAVKKALNEPRRYNSTKHFQFMQLRVAAGAPLQSS